MNIDKSNHRRGAIIVYGAISLFLMLIMAAMAIDIAYMQLIRTELRTSTDAASMAGCEALGRTQSRAGAIAAAKALAEANFVAREPLLLNDADIQIGKSAPDAAGTFQFTLSPPTATDLNSVRVDGRRDDGSASGRVRLFMGGILDTEFFAPRQQATSTTTSRDIALVFDRSNSMNSNNRLQDMKAAAQVFFDILETLPDDSLRCSLTTYATDVTLDIDLTSDYELLNNTVQATVAGQNTNIGDALRIGATTLLPPSEGGSPASRPFSAKAVVLLTDGDNTVGNAPFDIPAGETTSAVQFCADRGIPVFAIAFSAPATAEVVMQDIAAATGGFSREAANGDDLEAAFREIAEQLAVLLVQ